MSDKPIDPEVQRIADKITDEKNNARMKAMLSNPTFIHFMGQFFISSMKWACEKNYKFSNVGVDTKKTFITRDGKTLAICPTFTTKNDPEPKSPILLPGKDF
jgi:hypothetical protein